MSEFKEEHSVSKLIGSPPGYVGYERGGQLTNAVRDKPFSVILFDEVEKAHPKIMDIFLQVLDDGRLTDSRGQTVFFTEAVIIFTSNIGTRTNDSRGNPIQERATLDEIRGRLSVSTAEDQTRAIRKEIRRHFESAVQTFFSQEISRPELLNRIGNNIVAFNYINDESIQKEIVLSQIKKIKSRYEEGYQQQNLKLNFSEDLINYFVQTFSTDIAQFGGRAISNVIQDQIMPMLSVWTLQRVENGERGKTARIFIEDERIAVKSN